MVNREILRRYGCTPEEWRKKLEDQPIGTGMLGVEKEMIKSPAPEKEKPKLTQEEKIARLRRRVRSRVEAGRQYNLTNYRTYQALDLIWSSAFRQVSPTILLDTIKRMENKPTADIEKALKSIGLDFEGMFIDGTDPKTGTPTKILNPPVFLSVTIPLVSAYLMIRWAKIYNDRNLRPFMKMESLINSSLDRTRCEVLTARIQTMADQYGYQNVFKQAVFNMLLYQQCMQFTLEEWHYEQQLKFADKEDVLRHKGKTEAPESEATGGTGAETAATGASGEEEPEVPESKDKEDPKPWDGKKPLRVGDLLKWTVREGLRYTQPHPTRCYWDIAHPQWTLNTGTGCEYAGYWRVLRWKEIRDNPDFYNKGRVSWGTSWWGGDNTQFFNAVYNIAVMQWPVSPEPPADTKDREAFLASNSLYNESHGEQAVVVTEHREIVIPSEDGLGDYPYPVWARFVVAGDGTIVYAAPCCYTPVTVYRDNGDDRKTQDSSLGLKLIGFQDQVSNLLSQFVYAAKQNLVNLTFVDKNAVETGFIQKVKNLGEFMLRGINFFEYDSKLLQRIGLASSPAKAMESHRFPALDTNSIMIALKACIDLAERVLQFSSQEVAQAATHEQTKAEMDLIRDSTTNILRFTGDPVDQALSAQARQIYDGLMAYGDDDFYAVIPYEEKLGQDQLKELGITYVTTPGKGDKKVMARVKRSALAMWSFAYAPAPEQRKDNIEIARTIFEGMRDWFMSNQMGLSALGPDQLVNMWNDIARMTGLPMDRPLVNASLTTEEQNLAAQQQLKAQIDAVMTDVKKALEMVMEGQSQNTQEIAQVKAAIGIPPNDASVPNGDPAGGQAPGTPAIPVAAGV